MSVSVNVSGGPAVSVSVSGGTSGTVKVSSSSPKVGVAVGGGIGPQGPQGPQGPAGVAESISLIGDVAIDGIEDGDILRYEDSRWRNFPESSLTVDGGNW